MSKPFFKCEYMDEEDLFCGIFGCKHPDNKHKQKYTGKGSCCPVSCPIPETQGQIKEGME